MIRPVLHFTPAKPDTALIGGQCGLLRVGGRLGVPSSAPVLRVVEQHAVGLAIFVLEISPPKDSEYCGQCRQP